MLEKKFHKSSRKVTSCSSHSTMTHMPLSTSELSLISLMMLSVMICMSRGLQAVTVCVLDVNVFGVRSAVGWGGGGRFYRGVCDINNTGGQCGHNIHGKKKSNANSYTDTHTHSHTQDQPQSPQALPKGHLFNVSWTPSTYMCPDWSPRQRE